MNDEMLSQEEIDALLNSGPDEDESDSPPKVEITSDQLSDMQIDAIGEVGNISFGSAATALSNLLNQKVEITTPEVSAVENKNLSEEFPKPHVAVLVKYTEGFSGANVLVIKTKDAQIIADLMLGGDGTNPAEELNDLHISAVQEAMNQMMGSASTSMSTVFNKRIDISPPVVDLLDIEDGKGTENIPDEEVLIKVSFRLKIGNLVDSNIMQLIPIQFCKDLVDQLVNPSSSQQGSVEESVNANDKEVDTPSIESNLKTYEKPGGQPSITPQYEQETSRQSNKKQAQPINVQPAAFADFEQQKVGVEEQQNLNMLMDIPLQVTVELGRTKKSIKDILALSSGSIVELNRLAGEPVDILVKQKRIAKGEVVVIDENFGVRVTEITSQKERIQNLK